MIICPGTVFSGGLSNNTVVEACPTPTHVAAAFNEIILNGNLIIPPVKPPKKHIIKVTHKITLKDVEVITVTLPNGVVAGNKFIVSGIVSLSIQYVADVIDQKVHHVHYDIPFHAIVAGDCGDLLSTTNPLFPDHYVVHVCLEKIRLTQINNRTISKEIVLMVWVEQK